MATYSPTSAAISPGTRSATRAAGCTRRRGRSASPTTRQPAVRNSATSRPQRGRRLTRRDRSPRPPARRGRPGLAWRGALQSPAWKDDLAVTRSLRPQGAAAPGRPADPVRGRRRLAGLAVGVESAAAHRRPWADAIVTAEIGRQRHPSWLRVPVGGPGLRRGGAANGITFIGPLAAVMARLADKTSARAAFADVGLPLLPGSLAPLRHVREAQELVSEIGFPVIVKASADGGGRGMRVVRDARDFPQATRRPGPPHKHCSATGAYTSSGTCRGRGTSRSRCCATRTATGSISASVTAARNGATRSSSRSHPHRAG